MHGHEVAEEAEEHGEDLLDGVVTLVGRKVEGNAIGASSVALDEGGLQLEAVVLLAHPYILLDLVQSHLTLLASTQREGDLLDLAQDLLQIVPRGLGHETGCPRVDGELLLGKALGDEVGKLGVIDTAGLVDGTSSLEALVEGLALVGLLLVAQYEAGRGGEGLEVLSQ